MLSIYVDVWCRKNPWPYEIQGVIMREEFRSKAVSDKIFLMEFALWSNNIGEYLAICFWCIHGEESGEEYEVWTDSKIALGWVSKKPNIGVEMDEKSRELVDLAIEYFQDENIRSKVKFWSTKEKWDIPADFWRKFKPKKK